jgi:NADPH2:quinone reductase
VLVQLARACGATVIAGVGAESKRAPALDLGADAVVAYSTGGWAEQVRDATGGLGVDVVLESVGGRVGEQAVETARDGGGRIGCYGFSSGARAPLDAFTIGGRGLTVVGLLGLALARPQADQEADVARVLERAAAGTLRGLVHTVLPLTEAVRAHELLESRAHVGAVLLRPGVAS